MTAVLPDVDTIEHLDFANDVRCEMFLRRPWACGTEDHPADWYVATHCTGPLPICDLALRDDRAEVASGQYAVRQCTVCGAIRPLVPYRVLGPVR